MDTSEDLRRLVDECNEEFDPNDRLYLDWEQDPITGTWGLYDSEDDRTRPALEDLSFEELCGSVEQRVMNHGEAMGFRMFEWWDNIAPALEEELFDDVRDSYEPGRASRKAFLDEYRRRYHAKHGVEFSPERAAALLSL